MTEANKNNVLAGDAQNDGKVRFTPAVDDDPATTGIDESTPATLTLSGVNIRTKGTVLFATFAKKGNNNDP